ncbi:SPOR domain-containing protein [Caedibacter taeniospiralis]|jgi:cell division protein FtsN|uniref:SPOR domain-containing protein n=1 Tax=Caedibacter taeniospiralis TaxID=28907 RepID=UPI0037BE4990
MRDFAKNHTVAPRPQNKVSRESTKPSSFALRKVILAILLLILIVAFMMSFYSKNGSKAQVMPLTQTTIQQAPPAQKSDQQTAIQESEKVLSTPVAVPQASINAAAPSVKNKGNEEKSGDSGTAQSANNNNNKGSPTTSKKATQQQPLTFTFYDTLTNKTVQVDTNPEKLKQYCYTYMLQIGSYRNLSDANATRAKLILAGLKPSLKKVGDWYRLDVGPVYTQRDGDVLKHKVEAAGISGSILREVDRQEIPEQTSDATR